MRPLSVADGRRSARLEPCKRGANEARKRRRLRAEEMKGQRCGRSNGYHEESVKKRGDGKRRAVADAEQQQMQSSSRCRAVADAEQLQMQSSCRCRAVADAWALRERVLGMMMWRAG
eukprot:6214633-Pleurochrysis_carterae.AAC.4